MRKLLQSIVVPSVLGAISLLPSCALVAGAAVGAAAVAYVNGDLEGRFEASPQRVIQASSSALNEMEITVVSSDATGVDGNMIGRTALDKRVEITVKREGDTASTIRIRVDTFGDEALSRQIYDKIKSKI